MTRYMRASHRGPTTTREPTPPIWRGIGCLLILTVPVVSWVLAYQTVEWARTSGWQLPWQLMGYPVTPALLWKVAGLPPVLFFIERQPHLYMTLLVTVLYVVALSALVSAAYSFVYKLVGPSQLGPLDAPSPDIKIGRYKR
jgi:hypothetical protein